MQRNNVTMTAARVNAALTASVDASKEKVMNSTTCKAYYDVFCQKASNDSVRSDDCGWACALLSKEVELSGTCTSKYTDCSVKNGTGDKVLSCESMMKMATAVCGTQANDSSLVSLVTAYRANGNCANTVDGGVEFEPVTSETCVDDANWTDPVSPTKATCRAFKGLDCGTQYAGFSKPEIVKKFCPKTCGECVDCIPVQYPNTSSCDCSKIEVRGHPSPRFNGVYQMVNNCSQLEVLFHPDQNFNGIYTKASDKWNGHDHWVKKTSSTVSHHLYYYNKGAGTGNKGWNLGAVQDIKELNEGVADISQGGYVSPQPGSGAHGIHPSPINALGATNTKLIGLSTMICADPCIVRMQCTGAANKWNGRDHWMNCDKHLYFYNQFPKTGWNLGVSGDPSANGISEFKEGRADKFEGGWVTLQPGADESIGPVYSGKQVVLTLAACNYQNPCRVTMECTGKPSAMECMDINVSGKLDQNSINVIIGGGTSECEREGNGAGAKCVCLQSRVRRGFARLVN